MDSEAAGQPESVSYRHLSKRKIDDALSSLDEAAKSPKKAKPPACALGLLAKHAVADHELTVAQD